MISTPPLKDPATPAKGDSLRGERIVFAGQLASMTLRDARRIVRPVGGEVSTFVSRRTSLLVVGMHGWPLEADGRVSDRITRAVEFRNADRTVRIVGEREFLEIAGLHDHAARTEQLHAPDVICRLMNLDSAALDEWTSAGLLTATGGRYALRDIVTLHMLATRLRRGVSPGTLAASLRTLSQWLPDCDRALAQLHLLASSGNASLREFRDLEATADGQLWLDFRPLDEPTAVILKFENRPAEMSSCEWFDLGLALEEEERLEEAADAYRRAIVAPDAVPEAFFNLGSVLQASGRLDAAAELYRLAVARSPGLACGWYNLADALESQERFAEAIECLLAAIRLDAAYADAHFNLALLYEKTDQRDAAATHWHAYLRLDPDSEWAAIARRHLS